MRISLYSLSEELWKQNFQVKNLYRAISTSTIAKIKRGEPVRSDIVKKISEHFGLDIEKFASYI